MKFKIISGETLSQHIERDCVLLIDLRSFESYQKGHIPEAVWMDWENAEEDTRKLLQDFCHRYGKLPNWLILYCNLGNISLITARDLARWGYPVMSLNGGFHRWNGTVIS